jgi:hypothetical protein
LGDGVIIAIQNKGGSVPPTSLLLILTQQGSLGILEDKRGMHSLCWHGHNHSLFGAASFIISNKT